MYTIFNWLRAGMWFSLVALLGSFATGEDSWLAILLGLTVAFWGLSRAAGHATAWVHFWNYDVKLHANGRTGVSATRYVNVIRRYR